MFERKADVIETVQHAVALECVDLEANRAAIRSADFLALKIDRQDRVGTARGVVNSFSRFSG